MGPTETPIPTLTPTPAGPTTLNICTGLEPSSLYLYGDQSAAADLVRQAIYDGPIDIIQSQPQPVILEALPSLDNGAARIEQVAVQANTLVVDADGLVSPLQNGLAIHPSGCRSGDCAAAYSGGELAMDQLVLTFTLKPGLTWSDGQPLTASDSVYAFQLAADPATPSDKSAVNRTASYQASDERTIEWRGLPGYLAADFAAQFWSPLPQHAWGSLSAAELLTADQSNGAPIGWGPYIITEWGPGDHITLTRNANYWRANESLPNFTTLNIRFVGQGPQSNIQALEDGACDLLLPSTNVSEEPERLLNLVGEGDAQSHYKPSGSWLHLDFGVQSLQEGPNPLSAPELRRALAQCIDRQALLDSGNGFPVLTYAAGEDPLNNSDAAAYDYDPAAANAALDDLGWLPGQDGIRLAQTVTNLPFGTPLALTLYTADDTDTLAIAQAIRADLSDCGISLEIVSGSAESIFAPGPDGPLFGRQFDLALFAWPFASQPACWLYQSEAIPGEDLDTYRYGWGGWNLTGWSDPEFDAACESALNSLPGEAAYAEAHADAQAIFAEQLPSLPLFQPGEFIVSRPDFCGLDSAASPTLLYDIESYGFAEWCK
jgi:peptide/nickel transport system substrate-binding protein